MPAAHSTTFLEKGPVRSIFILTTPALRPEIVYPRNEPLKYGFTNTGLWRRSQVIHLYQWKFFTNTLIILPLLG